MVVWQAIGAEEGGAGMEEGGSAVRPGQMILLLPSVLDLGTRQSFLFYFFSSSFLEKRFY